MEIDTFDLSITSEIIKNNFKLYEDPNQIVKESIEEILFVEKSNIAYNNEILKTKKEISQYLKDKKLIDKLLKYGNELNIIESKKSKVLLKNIAEYEKKIKYKKIALKRVINSTLKQKNDNISTIVLVKLKKINTFNNKIKEYEDSILKIREITKQRLKGKKVYTTYKNRRFLFDGMSAKIQIELYGFKTLYLSKRKIMNLIETNQLESFIKDKLLKYMKWKTRGLTKKGRINVYNGLLKLIHRVYQNGRFIKDTGQTKGSDGFIYYSVYDSYIKCIVG